MKKITSMFHSSIELYVKQVLLLAFVLLNLGALQVHADIYKCTSLTGYITFKDTPCTSTDKTESILTPAQYSAEESKAAKKRNELKKEINDASIRRYKERAIETSRPNSFNRLAKKQGHNKGGAQKANSAKFSCPIGSHYWVDKWGNSICRSFFSHKTISIKTKGSLCPTGYFRSIDSWGNSMCKSFGTKKEVLYDTSKGCPIGSYKSYDKWGNGVCKMF